MKKINSLFFFLLLNSCTSVQQATERNIKITDTESIQIGQTKDAVKNILGPAQQIYSIQVPGKADESFWVYNEPMNQ